MTKLDFSGVKDARVGEREVQRIYRGDTKVWNKYCWEKWSCTEHKSYTYTDITSTSPSVGTVSTSRYGGSIKYLSLYANYRWGSSGFTGADFDGNFAFPSSIPIKNAGGYYEVSSSGLTVKLITDVYGIGEGDTITDWYVDKKTVAVAKRTLNSTWYTKGSTSYGVVEGYSGDYPDNGRHSDGYWYVRVDPVGVKEG